MARFEVLILGNSSALPAYGRHPTAQLLNIHEQYLLIDCGEGTQERIAQYQAKSHKIDHILISHLHGDHYFGLPGLITSMNLTGRKHALQIYAPPGLDRLISDILSLGGASLNFEIRWTYLQGHNRILLFDDPVKSAFAFPITHRISTYGFNISEKSGQRVFNAEQWAGLLPHHDVIRRLKAGEDVVQPDGSILKSETYTELPQPARSYCYCSDTIYEPAILNHIQSCDLLYHEATYTDQYQDKAKANFHSTAREAGRIASKAKVKKLLIGHFSSRYKILDDLLNEAQEEFEATQLAEEGQWYKI